MTATSTQSSPGISSTIAVLREVPVFAGLSDEQLIWIIEHAEEVWLEPGQVHRTQGDAAGHVFVLLDGEVQVTQRVGEQDLVLVTYVAVTLFGELPILLDIPIYFATGRALTRCHILEMTNDAFWEMLASWPSVARTVMQTTGKRVQELETQAQQRERLAALGRLSAGLAHELNNPAAAARRASVELERTLDAVEERLARLKMHGLDADIVSWLITLRGELRDRVKVPLALDPLTLSDREELLVTWMHERGIPDGWRMASGFVRAGVDPACLVEMEQRVGQTPLGDVLGWLDATITSAELLDEVQRGTSRISELVRAVREYTYMDQAPQQDIDVHDGIENTLIILNHKIPTGVAIVREYDRTLPRIPAFGSELNEVWTNLLDNAIDAIVSGGRSGTITISTARLGDAALVAIVDDGPGIAPEVLPRIWEPFFTTKDVGEGSGLGLDAVRRIVMTRHHGDVHVSSRPGQTRFDVRLPLNFTA